MFMKISDVIAQLEAIKAKEGDILTAAYCGLSEDGEMMERVIVETRDEETLYYKGGSFFYLPSEKIGDKIAVLVSR